MDRQRGFSLIELVMFIIIVSIAVAGMTGQFSQSASRSHEPLLRQKGVLLANFYMDEILRKKWNHNTPAGGGCVDTGVGTNCNPGSPLAVAIGNDGQTLSAFDDIDDYHGLNDNPPQDQAGATLTGFGGYSVVVTVDSPAFDPLGDVTRDVETVDIRRIRVDVTVTALNETLSLIAYRSNF